MGPGGYNASAVTARAQSRRLEEVDDGSRATLLVAWFCVSRSCCPCELAVSVVPGAAGVGTDGLHVLAAAGGIGVLKELEVDA